MNRPHGRLDFVGIAVVGIAAVRIAAVGTAVVGTAACTQWVQSSSVRIILIYYMHKLNSTQG